jgi:hypothetical protein
VALNRLLAAFVSSPFLGRDLASVEIVPAVSQKLAYLLYRHLFDVS